jgi:HTH-type transcriptional regulator / antitoxin HigA
MSEYDRRFLEITKKAAMELIKRFPLRPLRTDAELQEAIKTINDLLDRWNLDEGEHDYLDVLSDLVEKYEQEQHPISPASDGAMIRFLLDMRDLSQVDLARHTGIAESTISAVLSGKRQLSRRHIGVLASFFHVEPAVFTFAG